ncbi:MAG: cyclic nucleotide-binding domain-containing protein [Hyphomicrobiales bacterium]|nr:cyclic nucleotide-binding domain-containing protein [Hyphomicrobiales bacterium]
MAQTSVRRQVFDVVEGDSSRVLLSRLFASVLVTLILVNVIAAVFETVPAMSVSFRLTFWWIEAISVFAFTVEYFVRLWICVEHPRARDLPAWRVRLNYIVTPAAIIDLIAIVPFFIVLLGGADVRTMVLVRLMRLFKLGRYSTGFQSLYEAIRRERQALLASFLVLTSVVLITASLAYIAEREAQPEQFGTIPDSIWWALVTVTTVGYGETVPQTLGGRLVGGLTMITGILMIALPIAIIGSSFAEVVRQRSFVVTFGLVVRMPMFSNLGANVLHDLLPMIRATSVEAGVTIVAPHEGAEALYTVVEGVVELDTPQGRLRLGVGESFGASANSETPAPNDSALALSRVKLLVISRIDLIHLIARHPELANRFQPSAYAGDGASAG